MTEFFPFEDLTWPEVASLPRDLPLVIPLGAGYPLDSLASALGNPLRAGLLPAIPFGWPGSGLSVSAPALATYLANLLDSLQDDGFSQVFALTPPGLNWATWAGETTGEGFAVSLFPSRWTSGPLKPQPAYPTYPSMEIVRKWF
jgi:hypothetical protein